MIVDHVQELTGIIFSLASNISSFKMEKDGSIQH